MKRERYRNFRVLPRLKPHYGRTPFQMYKSEKRPRDFKGLRCKEGKRGKFPGERRWIYAGAGRMRLARGGIFGPGMPRRAPMNS